MKYLHPVIVILSVLIFDQALKFWVKLNFMYTESLRITDWFYLYFIENEGMAFGWSLGGEWGKLTLSLFRLLAVFLIGYYLVRLVKQKSHAGFITSISLIMAGAIGNILDSVFYGKLFSASTPQQLAVFMPEGGGYATWLHGRVVDMFYFPLYEGFIPPWVPIWGGEFLIFFRPIFNVADASITTGVFLIILFQKQFFKQPDKQVKAIPEDKTDGITPE
ncbi:MAG: lipoprotein signal peptidase [Chitinophagales bacterium]|nr:lipoprotein signal peptidase [Chitinophagales bacterium]